LSEEEQGAISNHSTTYPSIPLLNVARGGQNTALAAIVASNEELNRVVSQVKWELTNRSPGPSAVTSNIMSTGINSIIPDNLSNTNSPADPDHTRFISELCSLVLGSFHDISDRDPVTLARQAAARAGSQPLVRGIPILSVVGKDITAEAYKYGLSIFDQFTGQGPALHLSLLELFGLYDRDRDRGHKLYMIDWLQIYTYIQTYTN
jgi:hypothetical protein